MVLVSQQQKECKMNIYYNYNAVIISLFLSVFFILLDFVVEFFQLFLYIICAPFMLLAAAVNPFKFHFAAAAAVCVRACVFRLFVFDSYQQSRSLSYKVKVENSSSSFFILYCARCAIGYICRLLYHYLCDSFAVFVSFVVIISFFFVFCCCFAIFHFSLYSHQCQVISLHWPGFGLCVR